MNEIDPETLEAELRQLRPARPPQEFVTKLTGDLCALAAAPEPSRPAPSSSPATPKFLSAGGPASLSSLLWRWLLPAAAVALAAVLMIPRREVAQVKPRPVIGSTPVQPQLKADEVHLNQELVARFDAVARLPGGAPVRFRCQEWMDDVRWRDSARDVWVEQRTPRLEIVPVSYETD